MGAAMNVGSNPTMVPAVELVTQLISPEELVPHPGRHNSEKARPADTREVWFRG